LRAEDGAVLFSSVSVPGASPPPAFVYSQSLGSSVFTIEGFSNGTFTASLNGQTLFSCDGSARVITDVQGTVTGVIGAGAESGQVSLRLAGQSDPLVWQLEPNTEWAIHGNLPPAACAQGALSPPY